MPAETLTPESGETRTGNTQARYSSPIELILLVVSFCFLAFQTYLLFSPQLPLFQVPLHLGFALFLTVLSLPLRLRAFRVSRTIDLLLVAGVVATMIYYFRSVERLTGRMEGVDEVYTSDVVFGIILMATVLECVRRIVGWSLLWVILGFLGFGFLGRIFPYWLDWGWIPEMVKFSGFTVPEAIENFTMTANGLLGVTTSTSVMFVFYFVLFGAFYSAMGGGQLFTDIGLRVAGRQTGGAAKAAVVSSALMGTVSGSAVANVSAVGVFTIPLMRQTGYSATQAAAIEAVTSTGGQLMPPVMGVAAFVMAELLQIPYARIALAGVIPAIAFYVSLFVLIDLNARRQQYATVTEVISAPAAIWPRLYLLIPPVVLIALLAMGKSASFAAAWATVACLPTSLINTESRRSLSQWMAAVRRGCCQAAEVAVPIAAIGLIIEVAVQSNLALKFALSLVDLGSNNIGLSLSLIVFGCIVMGMGLPTVAAYMIGAIFFVPVMIDLGFAQLPAHFFVMYYCVLSMVTPPVALASFAAAGLAQADTMATSWRAFQISLAAFFLPFLFVYEPALLAQGTFLNGAIGIIQLLVATAAWAIALEGYLLSPLGKLQRVLIGSTGLILFLAPMIAHDLQQSFGVAGPRAKLWITVGALITLMATVASCMGRSRLPARIRSH